ncbi:MAG: type II toxin-antitoxin system RelE/ParE family toxin [Gallionella sp.]|nr:type II toxin-antitoxin system RelE/ParE family toxin [Gallionella sp.]
MKPLVRHERADEDVRGAIQYLLENAPASALDFVDVLEQTFLQIQRHPAMGSPRYAHELNLPDLRFWPCKGFPYLVFYFESAQQIDVWRVLHSSRDIPNWLQPDESKN